MSFSIENFKELVEARDEVLSKIPTSTDKELVDSIADVIKLRGWLIASLETLDTIGLAFEMQLAANKQNKPDPDEIRGL